MLSNDLTKVWLKLTNLTQIIDSLTHPTFIVNILEE